MADSITSNASVKEMLTKFGEQIIVIFWDNDECWYFGPGEKITDDMFITIGGVDYMRKKDNIHSKRGGKNGGISRCEIPCWNYKPVGFIQGFQILDNLNDKKYVDFARIYVQ